MLPAIEYRKLFEPYAEKITLEGALEWLQKEAEKRKIPSGVMEVAIAQTFLEMADGKKFSKKGCDCGCGLTNPHSALVHYLRKKMIDLNTGVFYIYASTLEKRLARSIEIHIALRWRIWRYLVRRIKWLWTSWR